MLLLAIKQQNIKQSYNEMNITFPLAESIMQIFKIVTVTKDNFLQWKPVADSARTDRWKCTFLSH